MSLNMKSFAVLKVPGSSRKNISSKDFVWEVFVWLLLFFFGPCWRLGGPNKSRYYNFRKNPSSMSGVLGLGLRVVGGSFWTFGGQNSFGFRVYAVLLSNIKGLAGGFVLCIVCGFCLPFAGQEKLHFALSPSNTIGVEGFRTLYCRWPCLAFFVTPELRTFPGLQFFFQLLRV